MKWPRSVGVRYAAAVRTMDSDHAEFGDLYMKIDASQLRYWVLKAGAEHVDVFRYIITAGQVHLGQGTARDLCRVMAADD